jgi:PAS domain S-box-containing protein
LDIVEKSEGVFMNEDEFTKEEIVRFAEFLGFGFYRVTEKGQFVECDQKAREIFGIPPDVDEEILSEYSITKFYVTPADRERRKQRLLENKSEPLCSSLSMRIMGKNVLLFDMCWCDGSSQDQTVFAGLISKIEESTLFPQMFETFPMGLYEVDNNDRIVRVNRSLLEIFKYKREDELLGKNIRQLYENEADFEKFKAEIMGGKKAYDILKLKDANHKTLAIQCFAQIIKPYEVARWGMMTDVTKRELYYRALDSMPTGYFYVEDDRLKECNDHFVQIQGFKDKKSAIGVHTSILFVNEKDREKYLEDLKKADERGEALHNYEFQIKRVDDGKILSVSVDSHLVKDSNGKVIGREGTVRDISKEIELRNKVNEAEARVKKTMADMNQLIHTFLHPVIKFAGNSELLYQVANILQKTVKINAPAISDSDPKALGEALMAKLIEVRDKIPHFNENVTYEEQIRLINSDELDALTAKTLEEKLREIINIYDYSLKTEGGILLERTIRDTALWVLDELFKMGYYEKDKLKSIIKEDFIEFLQGILFNYLTQGASILVGETEMMKREVEALRIVLGLRKERQFVFTRGDIEKILAENVQRFKPVLAENGLEIRYNSTGDLKADISANDIDRVICNLFHNTNKYSHGGKGRYVSVRARELQPDNVVEITIQNYGIPIKQEEIDSGKIWEFGYRGELVFRSDRDGTGVGLADAKEVIEAHQGKIFITSRPAEKFKESNPPKYKVPYLITVIIRIPKSR